MSFIKKIWTNDGSTSDEKSGAENFFLKKVAGRGVAGLKNPPPHIRKKNTFFKKMVKKNNFSHMG